MMNKNLSLKERLNMAGKITIRSYPKGTLDKVASLFADAKHLEKESRKEKFGALKNLLTKQVARYREAGMEILKACEIGTPYVTHNLIMTAANLGTDLVIQRLIGNNTYSLNITEGAVGTSTTAPTLTDTQLGAEAARATWQNANDISYNEAQFLFFFTDSMLNSGGSLSVAEFGMFVDGTGTANSGQMWNHALFSPTYSKVAGTDITVECDIVA